MRAEHHQLAGADEEAERLDVDQLVRQVGDGTLVELVDVDGSCTCWSSTAGRVRRHVAGTTVGRAGADRSRPGSCCAGAPAGGPTSRATSAPGWSRCCSATRRGLLPDGPVVVVPTARLHGVPWALLPTLADRAFGVVPSAAQWLRARDARPARNGRRRCSWPDPASAPAAPRCRCWPGVRPDAVHLAGADATVEAALAALDGARLAHVAAHGRFRADSPLFSALEMADGPLTVHDLERLTAAPHRMVLSACESGVLAPVGADELLGLASALFALGTAGLVCSVAEVNDAATAELMVDLHAHLDRGDDPATALLALRRAAQDDTDRRDRGGVRRPGRLSAYRAARVQAAQQHLDDAEVEHLLALEGEPLRLRGEPVRRPRLGQPGRRHQAVGDQRVRVLVVRPSRSSSRPTASPLCSRSTRKPLPNLCFSETVGNSHDWAPLS